MAAQKRNVIKVGPRLAWPYQDVTTDVELFKFQFERLDLSENRCFINSSLRLWVDKFKLGMLEVRKVRLEKLFSQRYSDKNFVIPFPLHQRQVGMELFVSLTVARDIAWEYGGSEQISVPTTRLISILLMMKSSWEFIEGLRYNGNEQRIESLPSFERKHCVRVHVGIPQTAETKIAFDLFKRHRRKCHLRSWDEE
jgi:hypothetical protein